MKEDVIRSTILRDAAAVPAVDLLEVDFGCWRIEQMSQQVTGSSS